MLPTDIRAPWASQNRRKGTAGALSPIHEEDMLVYWQKFDVAKADSNYIPQKMINELNDLMIRDLRMLSLGRGKKVLPQVPIFPSTTPSQRALKRRLLSYMKGNRSSLSLACRSLRYRRSRRYRPY